MDFLNKQNQIKEYIKTNLKAVLLEAELSDMDAYIDDYLDLDEYQQAKQLFFNFGSYNFDNLSNQSEAETISFSVYLVFQNNAGKVSKELMLKYSAAFYEMFTRSGLNFGGIADTGIINTVDFYNAAEGNQDVKVAEITLALRTEI